MEDYRRWLKGKPVFQSGFDEFNKLFPTWIDTGTDDQIAVREGKPIGFGSKGSLEIRVENGAILDTGFDIGMLETNQGIFGIEFDLGLNNAYYYAGSDYFQFGFEWEKSSILPKYRGLIAFLGTGTPSLNDLSYRNSTGALVNFSSQNVRSFDNYLESRQILYPFWNHVGMIMDTIRNVYRLFYLNGIIDKSLDTKSVAVNDTYTGSHLNALKLTFNVAVSTGNIMRVLLDNLVVTQEGGLK